MHANYKKTLFIIDLLGPYYGHVLLILGQSLGYFYNIFTSRCLNWLKFSVKSHACQIEENFLMLNCLDNIMIGHVLAILGPCFGYFYNILPSICPEWLNFSLWRVMPANWKKNHNVEWLRPYQGHFWLITELCSGHLYHIIVLEVRNGSNFAVAI